MNESADEPLNAPMDPNATDPALPTQAQDDRTAPPADKPVRSRRPAGKRAVPVDAGVNADAATAGDRAETIGAAAAPTGDAPAVAPARPRRSAARTPVESPRPAGAVDGGVATFDVPTGAVEAGGDQAEPVMVPADAPSSEITALPQPAQATAGVPADGASDAPAADGPPAGQPVESPGEPPLQVGELFAQVLSGVFDESAEPPPDAAATPPKRVLAPEPEAPKLHKVLAQAGVGSRRDMEQMIADGLVTVNGQPAHTGQRISFGDRIAVDGKPVKVRIQPLPARLIAYHKPVGEVVTHDDPQQRPTVFRRLPRLQQGKWQSVGRLDLNTEGLLLFTNNGQLANQLMHPRFGVEREYAVRLLGRVDAQVSAKLIEGIELEGQKCAFRSIEDGGGDGANHWYRVVITEGRNREVRRLFDAVGLTVSRLIRIRYGCVVLPRGLKRGVWVDLTDADLRAVRQLVSAGQRPDGGEGQGAGERQAGQQRPPRPPHEPRPRRDGRDGRESREPRPPQGQSPSQGNGPRQAPRQAPVSFDHVDRPRTFDPDVDPDFEEEIDHARIPNPLEQTFDKRFVQNPRGPAGGRGFGQGGGGFGAGGSAPRGGGGAGNARKNPGAPREPDPMQTSVGYIGGDAFLRRNNRGNGGGGGGGGAGGSRGGGPRGGHGGNGGNGGNGGPRGGGGYRGR